MASSLSDPNRETEEETRLIGTAEVLRKAMQVTKLSDMIDCFNQLKFSSGSIERDLPNYFRNRSMNRIVDSPHSPEVTDTDLIHIAKEFTPNRRFILLQELIEQKKVSKMMNHLFVDRHNDQISLFQRMNSMRPSKKKSCHDDDQNLSSLKNQVKIMRHVIAAQPSALEGIYLETLLNPDQWQANHHLLQTSPQETLTLKERQRLKQLLNQSK